MASAAIPGTPQAAIASGRMTPFQIAAVGLCVLINALDGFDVLAVAFTAPAISREWGLGPAQVGGLFSAGLAGMGIGAFTISPLGDKLGRRPAIVFCLAILTVGMMLSAITRDLTELVLTRVLTGLGIGGILASINTVVAEYASTRRRSLSISLMALGYPLGATVGGLAAVPLIGAFGWRSVFVLGGVVAAVLIPLTLLLLPESIQFLVAKRPAFALEKVNAVLRRLKHPPVETLPAPAAVQEGEQTRVADLFTGKMLGTTLMVVLLNASVMATVYFTVSWTPKMLSQLGFSDSIGIYASLMMNAAGAIGCLLFGLYANRFGLRRLSTIVFLCMAAAVAAFGAVPAQALPLIVAAFVAGFFLNTSITCLYTILPNIFSPATRATGTGIGLGGGRIGAVVGPYLAGLLMADGWTRPGYCLILALPMLVATAALYGLPKGRIQSPIVGTSA